MRQALGLDVRLSAIDTPALASYRSTWVPLARPGWPGDRAPDWTIEHASARGRLDRFEVAVWSGANVLGGLAIGRPSRGRTILRVDLLEGHPRRSHPLKGQVAKIVIAAAYRYAEAIDAAELRLTRPLPGVVPWYEGLGFVLVDADGDDRYCMMEMPR